MNLKRIVEICPLIAAFLIFNGFLKLYIFYGHWEIKIIDYLDLSEILLSFLDDLNIIILCFVIFILHQLFGIKVIQKLDNKFQGEISSSFTYAFDNHKGRVILILFIVTAISATLFFCFNTIGWLYIAIGSLFQLLLFISIQNPINTNVKPPFTLVVILTFLAFTLSLAFYDIKEVKENATTSTTTIYTDYNETVTTSVTNFLLGKSRNFIYLFDSQTHCTRIIPVDKVKSIETQKTH